MSRSWNSCPASLSHHLLISLVAACACFIPSSHPACPSCCSLLSLLLTVNSASSPRRGLSPLLFWLLSSLRARPFSPQSDYPKWLPVSGFTFWFVPSTLLGFHVSSDSSIHNQTCYFIFAFKPTIRFYISISGGCPVYSLTLYAGIFGASLNLSFSSFSLLAGFIVATGIWELC